MVREYHAQIAQTLQGKIASTKSETYQLVGRLKRVQVELNSQRDTRYTDLSSENRDLKERVDKLQGLQGELNNVNNQISEQARQLEELAKAKEEKDWALEAEKELKKESAKLRDDVERLAKEKADAERRVATTSAAAFQQAVDLTRALTLWVNFDFFDGKHCVKDHKIWLGDQMLHDPALHKKAPKEEDEEEEEASPGVETFEERDEPIDDGGNPKEKPEADDA